MQHPYVSTSYSHPFQLGRRCLTRRNKHVHMLARFELARSCAPSRPQADHYRPHSCFQERHKDWCTQNRRLHHARPSSVCPLPSALQASVRWVPSRYSCPLSNLRSTAMQLNAVTLRGSSANVLAKNGAHEPVCGNNPPGAPGCRSWSRALHSRCIPCKTPTYIATSTTR